MESGFLPAMLITLFASGNTIGGAAVGAGKIISANGDFGVEIFSNNNTVQDNTIGIGLDKMTKLPNKNGWRNDVGTGNQWINNNHQ
jgi:hypothetical protein